MPSGRRLRNVLTWLRRSVLPRAAARNRLADGLVWMPSGGRRLHELSAGCRTM